MLYYGHLRHYCEGLVGNQLTTLTNARFRAYTDTNRTILATLYNQALRAGAVGVGNPRTSSALGVIEAWAEPGVYYITIDDNGVATTPGGVLVAPFNLQFNLTVPRDPRDMEVSQGIIAGDGMLDIYVDAVYGDDTVGLGSASSPVKTLARAYVLNGNSNAAGGRAGSFRLAGSAMGLIDRMPDITAQPGPTQKFGVGGVSMFTGAGTGIRGSGHNKDASTGKAMTWIVDSVAADALVKLSTGAYLERVAMTNRGAGGFAVLVQNEHCSMRDVLIQGCVGDGVHIITNNSDGNMFEQTTIRENGGVGWSITGSNTVEPPNGLLFIGCKGHGNQFQQWLYDSTDTTAGTNKAGENLLFLGCQAQGPGAYAGIGAPMVEIRGGKGMGWYDTYFETGGAQNFSALRIDAGGVAYNGRASQQVSFIRPRFHTNHTGTIPAVYIDHAQGCELLDPVFDVGYTPSSSQPLVYLGANTKGCRVRIGPQPQLTSVARNATVTDLGQGNDVLIWDYGLNQYVQVGQGPSYMTASGGDSGNSATAAPTISTTAISLANANFIPYTVGTNTTFTMPSGLPTGRVLIFRLKLTQTGGGFTAAFTGVKWNAATAPTLSATNGYVDIFRFMTHDGGTTWYGFVEGQHMA